MSDTHWHKNISFDLDFRVVGVVAGVMLLLTTIAFLVFTGLLSGEQAQTRTLQSCLTEFQTKDAAQAQDIKWLYERQGFCYNNIGSQILLDENLIGRDNYIFQRHESVILLVLVVAITLSGVLLAGVQLMTSYKLALLGKVVESADTKLDYSPGKVSFQSSVVGLVILVVSFAFFLVFVTNIYVLKPIDSNASGTNGQANAASGPTTGPSVGQAGRFVPSDPRSSEKKDDRSSATLAK